MQKQYYTEKINSEPKWCLAGIYADKGITGTSTKNRDEFNKMIRDCKKGKIDRIIIWTTREKTKKVVWRCINRLDYGKKYCKHSPSIEESVLQNAIMDAIMKMARENANVLKTLKSHIAMGLNADSINDNSIELQIRIAEIDAEFSKLITSTNTENENDDDRETLMEKLLTEKNQLKKQLEEIELLKKNKELTMSRLDEIYSTIDLLRNHPITYDDQIIREILECVVVESKYRIKVIFKGGVEIVVHFLN